MRFGKVAAETGHRPRTRRMATMLTAALVTGATVAALPGAATAVPDQPATGAAPAAAAACSSGNFCLWENANAGGGRYFHSGSDGNLNNDYFRAGVRVGNNASSVRNNGVAHAYDDVTIYDGVWNVGRLNCIPRGLFLNLGTSNDRIESFAWTASC